jgi:hypothetical protein
VAVVSGGFGEGVTLGATVDGTVPGARDGACVGEG